MMKKSYEDYKYVMQDAGNVYLGSKFSYQELLNDEDVPFKFKMVMEKYLTKNIETDIILEEQLYDMEPSGFEFECYKQLKTQIKVSMLVEKKSMFGKISKSYKEHIYGIVEFANLDKEWKKTQGIFIQEIIVSKLSLMTFSL